MNTINENIDNSHCAVQNGSIFNVLCIYVFIICSLIFKNVPHWSFQCQLNTFYIYMWTAYDVSQEICFPVQVDRILQKIKKFHFRKIINLSSSILFVSMIFFNTTHLLQLYGCICIMTYLPFPYEMWCFHLSWRPSTTQPIDTIGITPLLAASITVGQSATRIWFIVEPYTSSIFGAAQSNDNFMHVHLHIRCFWLPYVWQILQWW